MTSMNVVAKQAQKFTIDNSPLILTAIATAGVVGTAVLAGKASFKAANLIADEEEFRVNQDPLNATPFTKKDKVKLVWTLYLPAVGVGVLTCGSVIGANHIGTSRAAALATAFTLSQKAAQEYKDKVVEKIGETREKQVVDEVAKQRVILDPPTDENVIIVSSSGQWFQDSWSGRYFQHDMEEVRRAVNELNHQVNIHGYATLSDFYDLLGLQKTKQSDEIGWNGDALLDVYFSAVMHEDGKRPVMAMEYRVVPSRDYFRTH